MTDARAQEDTGGRDPSRGGRPHAVVVGAGLGGLAAAVALHSSGWSVEVLEQAPHVSVIGAGIAIAPNALRALDVLGSGRTSEHARRSRAPAATAHPTDGGSSAPTWRLWRSVWATPSWCCVAVTWWTSSSHASPRTPSGSAWW